MKLVIKIFGGLLILIGAWILFDPEIIFSFAEDNLEKPSFYIAAIVARLVLGVILIISASQSKYPTIIKVLGFLSIIAALTFLIIGRESFQGFISSLLPFSKSYGLIGGLLSMAFGGFLIYAFQGRNK